MKKIILTGLLALSCVICNGQSKTSNSHNPMNNIDQIYTVFITKKLKVTVNFYETYFGFSKIFESTFFVLLQTTGEQKFNVAFMDEEHPTAPPTPNAFHGSGSFLTLEVADAKSLYEDLKRKNLSIAYELKDEPWGQRRFGILDPNGLWVDVVQQIQPVEGYWDNYIKE